MADLIALNDYKTLLGINPTMTRDDDQITALLPAASRAIRQFTDRKFEISTGIAQARTFQYDGSGFLDIDDCTAITEVRTDGGYPGAAPVILDQTEWTAQPQGGEVFYYVMLHGGARLWAFSPEMGFKRNLDKYNPVPYKPVSVTVTATWGWTEIPADIKLAAAWTIQDTISKPSSGDLQAESIAGYSRSWATVAAGTMLAIPNRARDIISNYARAY
jgi:Phage gp6-like head-tail connector protein